MRVNYYLFFGNKRDSFSSCEAWNEFRVTAILLGSNDAPQAKERRFPTADSRRISIETGGDNRRSLLSRTRQVRASPVSVDL